MKTIKDKDADTNHQPLGAGEIIRHGDQYCDPYTGEWWPSKCAGRKVGITGMTSMQYRRPMTAKAA